MQELSLATVKQTTIQNNAWPHRIIGIINGTHKQLHEHPQHRKLMRISHHRRCSSPVDFWKSQMHLIATSLRNGVELMEKWGFEILLNNFKTISVQNNTKGRRQSQHWRSRGAQRDLSSFFIAIHVKVSARHARKRQTDQGTQAFYAL
jgi:hypothetical protein